MSTVLFVSGSHNVVQSKCQHLAAKGYDAVLAASATEASRSLHTLMIDAVIFDTAVSEMSTHDFCQWLCQDPLCEDVPTLFLALAAFRWLPGSVPMRIGRDTLVSKPFLCSEIEQTLTRLLGPPTTPVMKTLTVGDLVRSHMRNLRRKIGRVARGRDAIRTLPRRGYRLTA
jgi:DNA-binding response OmpR family regulator